MRKPGEISRYSDWLVRPGFNSWKRQEIVLYATASRPALGPMQHSTKYVLRFLSPGREADHPPPSSAEITNGRAIPPLLHTSSWHGAQLIKHMEGHGIFQSTKYLKHLS
jgi:hypothetical protein